MKKKKPAGEEYLIPDVGMDRPKKLRKKEKGAKARDRHGQGKGCTVHGRPRVGARATDSYETQAMLYLEEMRAEYAKAFSRIDIFSKVEGNLNTPEDPKSRTPA